MVLGIKISRADLVLKVILKPVARPGIYVIFPVTGLYWLRLGEVLENRPRDFPCLNVWLVILYSYYQALMTVGSRTWGNWWDGRGLLNVKIYDFAIYADKKQVKWHFDHLTIFTHLDSWIILRHICGE